MDPRPSLLDVHVEDPVHVFGKIDDHRLANSLAGETGTSASWQKRDLVACRQVDDPPDVIVVFQEDDSGRYDPVVACVGREQLARHRVEPDVAVKLAREALGDRMYGVAGHRRHDDTVLRLAGVDLETRRRCTRCLSAEPHGPRAHVA